MGYTLHAQNAITNLDEMRVWRRIIRAIAENIASFYADVVFVILHAFLVVVPMKSDKNTPIHSHQVQAEGDTRRI